MNDSGNHIPGFSGFARLNNIYGSTNNPAQYKWNGNNVVLSQGSFDENAYLAKKLEEIAQKDSELPQEVRQRVLDKVAQENSTLIFDMASAPAPHLERLNSRFDFLLQAAFANAEHEFNVRKSREKITKSHNLQEGWMSASAMTDLVRLNGTVKQPPPDARKFVPKDRR
ncbi:MAG: hypothetical protein K2X77_31950 [Candidatus Obscuribacterales bacterium]|nr:hypothetical protein [Candidatus Obscuribacterales bacterium]